jgi:NADH-quinone oxidoreductase subunit L
MEGPTPVSALIHAATMVTAGVYMVSRSHVIFERAPIGLSVVAIIGTLTAFFAATIGIAQTDIKKVLAYSTVSQLGYMFMACGVGAFSAGIFHLMTHAFFKGLLFPCGRFGDSRGWRRAGHAQDGWPAHENSLDVSGP